MTFSRLLSGIVLTLSCASVFAATPTVNSPLPLLDISERGELTMAGDDFTFTPWRSDANLGKVQVIQYFGATMSDSKIFEPFTDLLQKSVKPGVVHVSTVLNMDAAMWGTSGFVLSELEKNKRVHPDATMVVDEKGAGVTAWDLGDSGSGLIILDSSGIVQYFTQRPLSAEELTAALALVKKNADS